MGFPGCRRIPVCHRVSIGREKEGTTDLGHGVLDHLLVRHIALVTDEQFVDAFRGIAVDFLQPLLDVVERVHVRHVVDDADAMGATVVGGRDGAETFLTGGIPLVHALESLSMVARDHTHNLELDRLAVEFNRSDFLPPRQPPCLFLSGVPASRRTKSTPMVGM